MLAPKKPKKVGGRNFTSDESGDSRCIQSGCEQQNSFDT
jgi:hypothetical protein